MLCQMSLTNGVSNSVVESGLVRLGRAHTYGSRYRNSSTNLRMNFQLIYFLFP